MGTIINDVQIGKDTRIDICSQSHGRKRVPMAQTLSFTPTKAVTLVGEFDNRYPVTNFETFEGVDVAFEVTMSDQNDVEAMIMDTNLDSNVIQNDPAQHQPVTIFCNYTGHNSGYGYAAEYAEGLRVSAFPTTSNLKDATKTPYSFKGTRYLRVAGKKGQKCSIQYDRFTRGTVPVVTADDNPLDSNGAGTFDKLPITLPLAGGANGPNYIRVKKNGQIVESGFTIVSSTFTASGIADQDIYEVWTVTQA